MACRFLWLSTCLFVLALDSPSCIAGSGLNVLMVAKRLLTEHIRRLVNVACSMLILRLAFICFIIGKVPQVLSRKSHLSTRPPNFNFHLAKLNFYLPLAIRHGFRSALV